MEPARLLKYGAAAMEGLQEIGVVARHEAGRTFRSARVIVLLALYVMFSALILLVIGSISQAIGEQLKTSLEGADPQKAAEAANQLRTGFLSWFLDSDSAVLDALQQVPLVVIIVFKATLFWLPPYVVLMAFDTISGEVGPRSIRFLTVRARRSSILLGKFLGHALVLAALVFVVDVAIFVYAKVTHPDFGWGLMLVTLLKFWLASVVYALAYLALSVLCSALFRQWALSLIVNFISLFVLWLVNFIAGFGTHRELLPNGLPGPEQITSWVAYLRYFTPSYYATGLLNPAIQTFALSGAAYAGFTLLFAGAAYGILRARDL